MIHQYISDVDAGLLEHVDRVMMVLVLVLFTLFNIFNLLHFDLVLHSFAFFGHFRLFWGFSACRLFKGQRIDLVLSFFVSFEFSESSQIIYDFDSVALDLKQHLADVLRGIVDFP